MTNDLRQTSRTGDHDTDVLVVGAGPVGLTLACALAHHGVRVRVVDHRTEPRADSLANNLWSRPQELLATIGVLDVLAADADAIHDMRVFIDGETLDAVPIAQVDSPRPAALYSSQAAYRGSPAGPRPDAAPRSQGRRAGPRRARGRR